MIKKNGISDKKRGEEVVFHLRRHKFIFFKMSLMFIFLLAIPGVVYYFLRTNSIELIQGNISQPLILILIFIYYLVIMLFAFTAWTETYLDVWTVTTERIINREQHGLFNRVVSEIDLYRVQDVTAEQKGFFATILHYGNVYIQSAGAKERFAFEQIANPYKVAKMIQRLDEKAKKDHHVH